MLDKLKNIEQKFQKIADEMADPGIASDHSKYSKLAQEYSDLEPLVLKYREYRAVLNSISESKNLLMESSDDELRELAKMELEESEDKKEILTKEIQRLLVPPDPNDLKNTILEIRAGTGGDEAAIFAGDLYRMYARFCELNRWKMDPVSLSEGEHGGFKEIIVSIRGKGAYGKLKYESGVHRVRRLLLPEDRAGNWKRCYRQAPIMQFNSMATIPAVSPVHCGQKPKPSPVVPVSTPSSIRWGELLAKPRCAP